MKNEQKKRYNPRKQGIKAEINANSHKPRN